MNEIVKETTTAGSVASVATPVGGLVSRQMKNPDGTVKNALDIDTNIMGQKPKKKNSTRSKDKQYQYTIWSIIMTDNIKEGLADLADRAERDHEVQMARSDLYKIAKYAIKLHEMLKGVSEEEGLEGWVQSKITKASDYIGSVYHYMDYDEKFDAVPETAKPKRNKPILSDAEIKSYKGSLKEKLESIK